MRHRGKNGTIQHGKRYKAQSSAAETFVKDLEEERDYWKSQVHDLQQLLRSKSSIATSQTPTTRRSRSRSLSPTHPATRSSSVTSPARRKTVSRATSPVSPVKKVSPYLTYLGQTLVRPLRCASGCVVECRICNWEVAGSNLSLGYFAPRSTQPSILPGSVNEYQLRLGRPRQVWLIPTADERVGVQVKLRNPLRTRAIPERFRGGDSLRRGAISSVCTFTFTFFTSQW